MFSGPVGRMARQRSVTESLKFIPDGTASVALQRMHITKQQPSFANPGAHVPFRKRLGRCYEFAGRLASANPNAGLRLVHGSIEGNGRPRIGHAWIEFKDGWVWEPTTNKVWTQDAFERFFSARIDSTYDVGTVYRLTVQHKTWGPWTGSSSGIVKSA